MFKFLRYLPASRPCQAGTHPSVDLALPAAHFGGDVVLHDGRQGGFIGDARDPARQLRVPDGRVATDQLVVGCRPVNQVVGRREGERVA